MAGPYHAVRHHPAGRAGDEEGAGAQGGGLVPRHPLCQAGHVQGFNYLL